MQSQHLGGGLGVLPQKNFELRWSESDSGGFLTKKVLYAKQLHPTYSSSNYFVQTNNIHNLVSYKEHKHTRMYKLRTLVIEIQIYIIIARRPTLVDAVTFGNK